MCDMHASAPSTSSLLPQTLRAELAQEWSEVPVVGGSRLVLGPGGQLLQLLTAQEALQVEVRGFGGHGGGAAPDPERLRAALLRHGAVKKLAVLQLAGGHCVARAMLDSPAAAAAAVRALDGTPADSVCGATGAGAGAGAAPGAGAGAGLLLTAQPFRPKVASQLFLGSSSLRVSWSSGVPTHKATASFGSRAQLMALLGSAGKRALLPTRRHGGTGGPRASGSYVVVLAGRSCLCTPAKDKAVLQVRAGGRAVERVCACGGGGEGVP